MGTMKKSSVLFWVAVGLVSAFDIYRASRRRSQAKVEGQNLQQKLSDCGFRVSTQTLANGDQYIRFRGCHESLMQLTNPEYGQDKPAVPEDLDVDSLPSYYCGCPHCGKMSLYGEGQWRYQELSRTRGHWNNTTTYLVLCQNCQGFMKSTVDHDD